MKRRDFLRHLVAAPVAAALAVHATPAHQPLSVAAIDYEGSQRPALTIQRRPEPISIRYVRSYAFDTDKLPNRFDVIYGVATVSPNFAIRVSS